MRRRKGLSGVNCPRYCGHANRGGRMKRAIAIIGAVAVFSLAGGCADDGADPVTAGPSVAGSATPTPEPTLAGAATIADVWAKIGCAEDDPTGTGGVLDLSAPVPPVEATGMCTPYDGGGLVFFFQLPTADDVPAWLSSGALEVGATDAVYTDGSVVILATDASTAQQFATIFTAAE